MYRFESGAPFCEPSSGIDLKFHYCGTLDCDDGRFLGPVIRDHWRLAWVQEGRGRLTAGNRTWALEPGSCFLICPDVATAYRPEPGSAWAYHWVAFSGLNAQAWLRRAGLSADHPVAAGPPAETLLPRFEAMYAASRVTTSGDLRLLAELLGLLALLMDRAPESAATPRTSLYVAKAVEWFEVHFHRDVSIAEVVDFIGLNPKYFSRLFKAETGRSPQDFLVRLRMDKAQDLLAKPGLSVGDVARSVGYPDPLQFSRMFKKTKGVSPAQFRRAV
jgi:AraC-like DNA-binding protein